MSIRYSVRNAIRDRSPNSGDKKMNTRLKLIFIASSIIISAFFPSASWARNVVQEIRETGVLKVGIRKDAFLFGYEDKNGNWTGYCASFANALASTLSRQLNTSIGVRAVLSTIQNREEIVRDGTVHFECGPNSISREKEVAQNIKYSQSFFITGTQFIVKTEITNINLSNSILGVLQSSTNLRYVAQNYPNAEIKQFSTRSEGVSAVRKGRITAFAGDNILLIGEAVLQGWPSKDFEIVPNKPLSCDVYGMILPANDPQWESIINSFIGSSQGMEAWGQWFGGLRSYVKGTLDYCKS
jgi:polar amino acid transport system substrate-binding protein